MQARRRRRGQNPKPYKERDRWKFKYRTDEVQQDGSIRRAQRTKVLGRTDEMSFSEACREARQFVDPIDKLQPGIEHSKRTMADLIQRWRQAIAPNLKRSTCDSYEWGFKRIEPTFGAFKVSEIERPDVQRFLTDAGRSLAPESIHDLRARIRGLLSVAVDWGWIGANPAAGRLRLPKRCPKRVKNILAPDHFQSLVFVLPRPYSTVFVLAVLGGLRKGEMEALRWLDFSGRKVVVDEAVYRQYSSFKYPDAGGEVSPLTGHRATRSYLVVAHLALDATRTSHPPARVRTLVQQFPQDRLIKRFLVPRGGIATARASLRRTTRTACRYDNRSGSWSARTAASCINPRIAKCAISNP